MSVSRWLVILCAAVVVLAGLAVATSSGFFTGDAVVQQSVAATHSRLGDNPPCVPTPPAGETCHGWTVAAPTNAYVDTTKISDWQCTFNVPQVPADMSNGVTHYLYCNYFNKITAETPQSQFVPQLMIGNTMGCGTQPGNVGSRWFIQAQYYYGQPAGGQGQCVGGAAYPVRPGDTITSNIEYLASGAYQLSISSAASAVTSTVTIDHPWMDPSKTWAQYPDQYVTAAFESWAAAEPDQYPSDSWTVTSQSADIKDAFVPSGGNSTLEDVACPPAAGGNTCTWSVPAGPTAP